ncbi:hypothetical protein [Nocardia wallacei]|uniref:hypothetical protein n=1 Tax=Nocardia wallacei TaxID=480035 RepID=UPI002458E139|nr:hypothetical protein [Nocardia wallacei]
MGLTQSMYGIVRADLAGVVAEDCVREIRRWAHGHGFDLRGIECVYSDTSFPLLIATLRPSRITAVAVPSLIHVAGWVDALRSEADVWTMHPLRCWPHRTAPPTNPNAAQPQRRRRE